MFWALVRPSSGARDYTFVTGCCPAPVHQLPATKALHATWCNKSIVSSSWWWAYECPKHVEQIIRSINYWVASSWFSSPRISNNSVHIKHFPRSVSHKWRRYSGMCHCVTGWAVPNISEDHSAFIFKGQAVQNLDLNSSCLEERHTMFLKMVRTHSTKDTVSYPSRSEPSAAPGWEPQFCRSHKMFTHFHKVL
jgi:hypothetical protein